MIAQIKLCKIRSTCKNQSKKVTLKFFTAIIKLDKVILPKER